MPDAPAVAVEVPEVPQTPETPIVLETPAQTPDDHKSEEGKVTPDDTTVEIKDVQQDTDGNLVFVVDPGNPKSTVYKGKNWDELFSNVRKGYSEKDNYIAELTAERLDPKSGKGKTLKGDVEDDIEGIKFPERGEAIQEELKRFKPLGVTEEMLSWGKQEWRDYEVENGATDTIEMKGYVKEVIQVADQHLAEGSVRVLNDKSLFDETDQVEGLLKKYKITGKDGFDYDSILNATLNDPKSYFKSGIRRSGAIISAARDKIQDIVLERELKSGKTKSSEELANARIDKEKAKSEAGTKTEFKHESSKVPKNSAEAVKQVLEEYRASQKK